MIFHPAVIALLATALLVCLMLVYASYHAFRILESWDLSSGSQNQLVLERQTYLISTVLTYTLGFQLFSLFLYLFVAEDIHTFFVGAMCAAGSLNVNSHGYPALIFKVVNFLAAGGWLIVNRVDNKAHDYPLIRLKYLFLLGITASVLYETWELIRYFIYMKGDIITSCCGSLFGTASRLIGPDLLLLPPKISEGLFALCLVGFLLSGVSFYRKGKAPYLFSILTIPVFLVSVYSMISFISPYFYELPTHRCPFCLLQSEYHYVGYLLYISLLLGAVTGLGVGMLAFCGKAESLKHILPMEQRRLTAVSLISFSVFAVVVILKIALSGFVLES